MNQAAAGQPRAHASLALRIALASALFGLVVAAGAIAVGFWTLSQQLDERSAAEMQGRRELLVHILATVPSLDAVSQSESRFSDLFFGHDDLHLALVEPGTGRVLAAFSDIAFQSVTALGHAAAAPETWHTWVTPTGARFSGMHGTAAVADGHQLRFYLRHRIHGDAYQNQQRGAAEIKLIAHPRWNPRQSRCSAHKSVEPRSDQR